jgi:NitT/TauT family transport system substrate-binding protein
MFPLAQMRNVKETQATLGGNYPEASIYATREFVTKNPKTVQAIANAMVAAEKWMAGATPEEVARAVPSQYAVADKAVFAKAYTNMRQCLSQDGLMAADAPKTVRAVLAAFDPSVAAANIDLNTTYDNSFVQRANKQ